MLTSTRISARMRCVQEHSSPVKIVTPGGKTGSSSISEASNYPFPTSIDPLFLTIFFSYRPTVLPCHFAGVNNIGTRVSKHDATIKHRAGSTSHVVWISINRLSSVRYSCYYTHTRLDPATLHVHAKCTMLLWNLAHLSAPRPEALPDKKCKQHMAHLSAPQLEVLPGKTI